MARRNLNCNNEWWDAYGKRVNVMLDRLEEKRFQDTFDGDINYNEVVFLSQGMMFALEKTQNELSELEKRHTESMKKINDLIIENKKLINDNKKLKELETDVISDQ